MIQPVTAMSATLDNFASANGNNTSEVPRKPRVCMATARKFKKRAFHCGHYESQDVLAEIADVDLVLLEPESGYQFKESWQRRLLYKDVSRRLIFANPGLKKVRLNKEYDLFVAGCQTHQDLLNINAIEGWKDHCKISVCWIDELWASMIPHYRFWIHALKKFDYVFLGCKGTVAALTTAIDRPCKWVSGAVDTLRFSPYPDPPERVIDVYSIGRRWEEIHQRLLCHGQGKGRFYLYDTFQGGLTEVQDYRQHRDLFANVAKRSRYFMVAPGKMDAPEETQGQVEVGHRYYEGAAAGTVMVGQAPDCDAFRELFPWDDPVIHVEPNGSDVCEVLTRLDSEPERVAALSRRNASQALLRHDWVYRWKEIFETARIPPSAQMAARERRLAELAELAAASST